MRVLSQPQGFTRERTFLAAGKHLRGVPDHSLKVSQMREYTEPGQGQTYGNAKVVVIVNGRVDTRSCAPVIAVTSRSALNGANASVERGQLPHTSDADSYPLCLACTLASFSSIGARSATF